MQMNQVYYSNSDTLQKTLDTINENKEMVINFQTVWSESMQTWQHFIMTGTLKDERKEASEFAAKVVDLHAEKANEEISGVEETDDGTEPTTVN